MKKPIIALLSICMTLSFLGACAYNPFTSAPHISQSTGSESTGGSGTSSDSSNPEIPDSTGGGSSDGNSSVDPELPDNKEPTVIHVKNFGGSVGTAWLDNAIDDFREYIGDKQYEEGKAGVVFEITSNTSVKSNGMQTDGTHLYFLQDKYSNLYNLIQTDAVLDITDVVTSTLDEYGEVGVTIESKIDERYRFAMQGTGDHADKYYMLPHYEAHSGASYDVDMFNDYGFYLAKPGSFTSFRSELVGETFYFTDMPSEKTVGNDGIAGTDDDGMPTTLNELVAMCEYIKSNNVWPFSTPGGHIDYANYLIEGLWTALAGYEQRAAVTTLEGEVDYVTGVSSEDLWKGTGIKKPITEKGTVTVETGYKAINQAGRYYAFAFMKLAEQQDWFYYKYLDSSYNHKSAMRSFILNGLGDYELIAAHVEGSYWYNEAESYGLFNDYKTYSGGKELKNIGHWHMPTTATGEVVTGEDNAREEAVTNTSTGAMYINGNLAEVTDKHKIGVREASKEFFKFLLTDTELRNYAACAGSSKAIFEYDIQKDGYVLENIDPYQQSILRLRASCPVVNQYGDNDTYRAKGGTLAYGASATGFSPNFDGVTYKTLIEVFYKTGTTGKYKSAWDCFQRTGFEKDKWLTEIYTKEE